VTRRASRTVPGFKPRYIDDTWPLTPSGWSVEVFRHARRADLRTGYAGPKPSLIARVHRAALNLVGRRPIP